MKNRVIVLMLVALLLLMLPGCEESISNDTGADSSGGDVFADFRVGDEFDDDRDGYLIKLNDSFFAEFSYENPAYIVIYKLLDSTTVDFLGDSELFYSDTIDSECYCNNSNIIVHSLTNENYVLIDCNDINNAQSFTEIDSSNIDLSEFTKIVLYYENYGATE